MVKFNSATRLFGKVSAESEWRFLVNETLAGEKLIVGFLKDILAMGIPSKFLNESLKKQVDEEIEHVRMYHKLVGADKLRSSGYDIHLKKVVQDLNSVTLKLFALQGMLEGMALGALDYRILNWNEGPSFNVDSIAKLEESEHVGFSYSSFSDLIRFEGRISMCEFKRVQKQVNKIFSTAFNGAVIVDLLDPLDSFEIEAQAIEDSVAMKSFRRNSAKIVLSAANAFIDNYFLAAENV